MNRTQYRTLRRAYRAALHADRQWRPDPYAAHNTRQTPPRTAEAILAAHPALRGALTDRSAVPSSLRLPPGPRARWYRNWAPRGGRYHGFNLDKRVVFRKALIQIADYEASRRPLAYHDPAPVLLRATLRLEAQTMAMRADTARRQYNATLAH